MCQVSLHYKVSLCLPEYLGVQNNWSHFLFYFLYNISYVIMKWHTRWHLPIEFSLEQSLHFCTILALPLPPFNGALSYRTKKAMNTLNAQQVPMNFVPLPLTSHTAICPKPRHSFHISAGQNTKTMSVSYRLNKLKRRKGGQQSAMMCVTCI